MTRREVLIVGGRNHGRRVFVAEHVTEWGPMLVSGRAFFEVEDVVHLGGNAVALPPDRWCYDVEAGELRRVNR